MTRKITELLKQPESAAVLDTDTDQQWAYKRLKREIISGNTKVFNSTQHERMLAAVAHYEAAHSQS